MRKIEIEEKILDLGEQLFAIKFKMKSLLKGNYQISNELFEQYNVIVKERGDLQRNLGY